MIDGVSGSTIHSTLPDLLNTPRWSIRMNSLDEKRHKKIVHNLETIKGWITSDIQSDRVELLKQLNKIPRTLQQLAQDVRIRFSLIDFNGMI